MPGLLVAAVLLLAGLGWYFGHLDGRLEKDFVRAESRLARGEHEAALADFQTIYQRHPGFRLAPQARWQSAEILNLYQQRYDDALLLYDGITESFGGAELTFKARLRAAEIYKNRMRDERHAIALFGELLQGDGGGLDRVHYELADSYFRLEDYRRARQEFTTLAERYPGSTLQAEVHYRIGVIRSLEGDAVGAAETFRKVVARWPTNPYAQEALYSLASLLEESQDYRGAHDILVKLRGAYGNAETLERKIAQVAAHFDDKPLSAIGGKRKR